ncbi:Auxin-induced protein 10A5 [Glycine soja]|uniref:Auxin-induced protein 10A5 n=1 Tax=Glycine soja TaxID=3848 RepID=A0A445HPN7_GLYSO|nr:Auxin-induced protein 10A5 [Glycine soja]
MGFHIHGIIRRATVSTNQGATKKLEVAKGYLAVHVGDKIGWFMIPVSYLNQPAFQDLVKQKKNSDMIIQLAV